MENQNTAVQAPKKDIKAFLNSENVKAKFQELLGKRAAGFITSVLQTVNENKQLKSANVNTIYAAAAVAATLDLPVNRNLGFAWIVPYKSDAQFQMGWRGYVQLALRTNQYKTINATEVFTNQFISYNSLTGELKADFELEGSGEIVGYAAYFKSVSGYERTEYWTRAKVEAHAKRYSQAYRSASGITPWKDKEDFHKMALKTVVKSMLSKWGIMSIDIQTAVVADQAVIKDFEEMEVEYADNINQLEEIEYDDLKELYEMKKDAIPAEDQEHAARIIEEKVVGSYYKLHKQLQSL